MKIFWATVSANRTEYIVTNNLTQLSKDNVEIESQTLHKIEEFYRVIKQLTSLELCQCRLGIIQKSYCLCNVSVELLKKICF